MLIRKNVWPLWRKPLTEESETRTIASPATDILETTDNYIVISEMPGVDEKNVEVTLENDVLTIRGQSHNVAENTSEKNVYSEYTSTDYRRVFSLSQRINRDNIQARVKDGVLTLTLPKAESSKPRKILVNSASPN